MPARSSRAHKVNNNNALPEHTGSGSVVVEVEFYYSLMKLQWILIELLIKILSICKLYWKQV